MQYFFPALEGTIRRAELKSTAFAPDWDYATRYAYLRLRVIASARNILDDMVQDFLLYACQIYDRRKEDAGFCQNQMLQEAYWRVIDSIRRICGRTGQRLAVQNAWSLNVANHADSTQDRLECFVGDYGDHYGRMVALERVDYILSCLPKVARLALLLRSSGKSKKAIESVFGCHGVRAWQIVRAARTRAVCAISTYERGETMIESEKNIRDAIDGIPVDRQYKLLLHLSRRLISGAVLSGSQRRILRRLESQLTVEVQDNEA